MLIGDSVLFDGWTCVVVGFTPVSVRPAQVELSDPRTGSTFWVDLDQIEELEAPERAALKIVPPER